MSLPRYAEYKDSTVEWIGQLPAHWDVTPLKRKARLLTDKSTSRVRPVALENIEGWSGRYISTEGDFEGVGVSFEANDLLFGKLRPYLAKVYLADSAGEAVGDFHVIRPNSALVPKFVQYQLLQREFIDIVNGSTFGSKMPRASWESLGGMPFVVPTTDEQEAIAAFLDREIGKVDALIAEQEKLLALLAEKRQATISHAITRGLEAGAPMKDSSIPWLGDVPAHWTNPPLRLRYSCELGKMLDTAKIVGEHLVPYLRNTDVQWGSLNFDDLPEMDIRDSEYGRYTVVKGDLLVCEGGEVGRAALVGEVPSVIGFQKALHRLRAYSSDENPRFMYYTLRWAADRGVFDGSGQATIAHLTGEQLKAFRFAKPPVSEQDAIVEFLDAVIERLDLLRNEAERGIELLKERRSALIAAAVTGKVDVRGMAEQAA